MSKALRERLSEASRASLKSERALAGYMLAEFATLPFETTVSLADRTDLFVHQSRSQSGALLLR